MPKSISEQSNNAEEEKGMYTDFAHSMTYGDYLQLDAVLDSQKRLSGHHDEMLFIIIHQVSELWMKLMIHELNAAISAIESNEMQSACKMLARVSKIQSQLIQSWDVLATMTPSEYSEFRTALGQSSGFQSFQYRLIEFALGYKTSHILKIYKKDSELLKQLQSAYEAPGLYDAAITALHRAGFPINRELLGRDCSVTYKGDATVEAAWQEVYKNVNRYWELYQLAEKLVDIEDGVQQWRFRHMKTVERIIGFKQGTGGSSGVNYLKQVLDHRFFPELWDLRTKL